MQTVKAMDEVAIHTRENTACALDCDRLGLRTSAFSCSVLIVDPYNPLAVLEQTGVLRRWRFEHENASHWSERCAQ